MDELERWLAPLGLEQLASVLRANDIDLELLPELTETDLEKLGISLGHRKKLLKAAVSLARSASVPAAPIATSPPSPSATAAAERRQLTVMFCDLVGSTALAARLDPEDLREIIGAYHRCVADTVARFDGFVAKYMGDGVLVYFGYPQAHEDDAERAVRAGLALIDAVGRLAAPEPLQLRAGIGTGLVVVGDLVDQGDLRERSVVGDTPNLASRLQALAAPNTIVIGPKTRRLLGDLFEYRDLGTIAVKGFPRPVQACQVVRSSAVESRFEAFHAAALTPFVGRDEEIELLLRRWAQAQKGEGRVVLLSGEPGIGKSRLAKTLQERIEGEPHVRLRYFCSPFFQESALHPTITRLEHAARFEREDTPETKLGKLEALLAPTMPPQEDLALLTDLLSLPTERYPPLNLSPQRKKEKTFEALLRQLELLVRRQPVLMIYEDVHWIDPSSRELLDLVIERVQRLPVLLLITFRPEFQPPWIGLPYVTMHPLSRLDRRDGASLAQRVAGNKKLPDDIVDEIVARTDGVPLFVEELTKAVLEAGADAVDASQIVSAAPPASHMVPATLHASLMARLDRLGPAREVAQIGAAIGREFSFELLAAVAQRSDAALQAALDRLVEAGLVFRRGTPPQATFLFKHALVQDAAYGTLLRGRRQDLHARIARTLEERFPDAAESDPERVAQHYTAAGLAEPAVRYWSKAGQRAIARSANAEALAQLRKGLGLLTGVPETEQRRRLELDLQVALGVVLMAAQGWAAPEAGRANARAHELCNKIGATAQLWPVLYGEWVFHGTRGELDAARALAEEMLRRAKEHRDDVATMVGHRIVGTGAVFRAEAAAARGHLERALALYDPERHRSLAFLYATDPRVMALSFLPWVLFVLGYPEQARARSREALGAARELAHPYTLAFALAHMCFRAQWCRERREALDLAEALAALAAEQKFAILAWATAFQGWALTEAGEIEAGIARLQEGRAAWRATGGRIFEPYFLGLQAEAHRQAGRAREALDLLAEALARADASNERWFEAELHRLKGEALIALSARKQPEAESCFRRAIAIARQRNAKSWELRAATSLARLWPEQGKHSEARALLAPVYGWFTEGFDTPDLKEAKALLDELR